MRVFRIASIRGRLVLWYLAVLAILWWPSASRSRSSSPVT